LEHYHRPPTIQVPRGVIFGIIFVATLKIFAILEPVSKMWLAGRRTWPEGGTGHASAALPSALDDAELVAFDVGHDEVIRHPVLQDFADHGGAERGQARDRFQ